MNNNNYYRLIETILRGPFDKKNNVSYVSYSECFLICLVVQKEEPYVPIWIKMFRYSTSFSVLFFFVSKSFK